MNRTRRLVLALVLASAPAFGAPPDPVDRGEVRMELMRLLQRFPPELGVVLKLDPNLLQNASYLTPYPDLTAFLAAHPEVARQPQFYLEGIDVPFQGFPEPAGERIAMNVLGGLSGLFVFVVVSGVLTWLVKTFVAQRRWAQVVRIQTEAHNKLLDRFSGSEELIAYVQSPAGRRFLEAAPIPIADGPSPPRSPLARIVTSVQAGVVLAAAGVGLRLVALRLPVQASAPIAAVGTFVIAIGAGFVLSAGAAWFLSRRLGLWTPPAPASGGSDARA